VTLAVKYALDSKNDEEVRYKFKRKLMRLMFNRGYSHKEIENLFRFIEIMLELSSRDLKEKLYIELKKIVKEKSIMIITNFEEIAMEKGMKKGKIEGKIEIVKKALKKGYAIEEIADLTGMSVEEIKKLSE